MATRLLLTLFLLVTVLSCDQSQVASPSATSSTAALKHDTGCALSCGGPTEVFGDDWCEGGNWWWYIRCNFFTTPCAEPVSVKVYAVTTVGDVVPFGVDPHPDQSPSPCGTHWVFEVQGIAPRDSIGDNDRGFPKFLVEVYASDHSQPFSTFEIYSDIQLSPNDDLHRPLCKTNPFPDPGYPKRRNDAEERNP